MPQMLCICFLFFSAVTDYQFLCINHFIYMSCYTANANVTRASPSPTACVLYPSNNFTISPESKSKCLLIVTCKKKLKTWWPVHPS